MASPQLRALWNLHQVDAGLVDVRARAAALDPGRSILAEIKKLEDENEGGPGGEAKRLSSELRDLELAQRGIDEKIKRMEKELYGGKIVNPREVEAYEREIAALKRQRGQHDERILALWESLPPLKEAASGLEGQIEAKRTELAQHQKAVLQEKARLEQLFKELQAKRPTLAAQVDKGLLARYDAIRSKHSGKGMAEVAKKRSCGGCGTLLPERTLQMAREDKTVICESCHRILYYTEGLV
jgi:uncharacterized protein